MRRLILQKEGDWVSFRASNSSFVNCIRSAITPHSYRKYDSETGRWYVWWEKLPDLVELAKRFYGQVDRSALPDHWQYVAAGAAVSTSFSNKSLYEKLYLKEDAPFEVIKAAYQALVLLYHPDHNDGQGDPDLLNQVIEAYKEIKESIRKI